MDACAGCPGDYAWCGAAGRAIGLRRRRGAWGERGNDIPSSEDCVTEGLSWLLAAWACDELAVAVVGDC